MGRGLGRATSGLRSPGRRARANVTRLLRGLEVDGRRPPAPTAAVLVAGEVAGVVTSGNVSPTLHRGIALAFLPPEVGEGTGWWSTSRGVHARPGGPDPVLPPGGLTGRALPGPGRSSGSDGRESIVSG